MRRKKKKLLRLEGGANLLNEKKKVTGLKEERPCPLPKKTNRPQGTKKTGRCQGKKEEKTVPLLHMKGEDKRAAFGERGGLQETVRLNKKIGKEIRSLVGEGREGVDLAKGREKDLTS